MFLTALVIAALLGELHTGAAFCLDNPEIMSQIIKFAICSAVGQSFIFYTIANFDPLVLSTVTTTRKIFSVLLSIFLKGHKLSLMGWSGVTLACLGILSEMQDKMGPGGHGGSSPAAATGDAKKASHEHKHWRRVIVSDDKDDDKDMIVWNDIFNKVAPVLFWILDKQ